MGGRKQGRGMDLVVLLSKRDEKGPALLPLGETTGRGTGRTGKGAQIGAAGGTGTSKHTGGEKEETLRGRRKRHQERRQPA